ncbi:MAG: methionyl-tRNA formyltransferase [Verrucomicrobiota bacterium]|nr:methionyl-tRNA formyltransferase [Verrucomicrobiota bacterium]
MRIIFIGTGEIGVPALQMLLSSPEHHLLAVVTQPDKPVGRHQELQASPVKQRALENHVSIFQPVKIRERAAIDQLGYLHPEVIVVMAYGQILPAEILQIPAIACLNLHASLLPRHRGAAPIQAAIESGDAETGITVMYMNEGLDEGDILLQKAVPIRRNDTGGSLHEKLALLAPNALAEALTLLKKDGAPRLPQDHALATYAPKLTREHGEIIWTGPSEEIERKIRAMNPWPGAYTWMPTPDGPRKLKILAAAADRRARGKSGEVLRADKHGLLIGTGSEGVLLSEVQMEGKKRMSVRDFLLGTPVMPGMVFGEVLGRQ